MRRAKQLLKALLREAVVCPSETEIADILRILRKRASLAQINAELEPYGVRVDPQDAELGRAGMVARCGLDGVVLRRQPKSPSDFAWVERVLRHELVHVGQMSRAAQRGDPLRMYYGDMERIASEPGGGVNREEYLNNPQEVMAAAHDLVQNMRSQGLTSHQILKLLRHSPPGYSGRKPESVKRFLRYAVQYAQME